jgi:hypothetical protein
MNETGCCRISCKIDKNEGGKSQLDVGGETDHRLLPIHYTSIAEIKGFRFKLEKTFLHQEEVTKENKISSPRQASADPQRPFRRSHSREVTA